MSETEKDIQSAIMIVMQAEFPDALIVRQNTGAAKDVHGNFVRFGVKGQADIRACILGISVEVEVKSETGRQSKDQKNYQIALERAGGIYILSSSPATIIEEIQCQILSVYSRVRSLTLGW